MTSERTAGPASDHIPDRLRSRQPVTPKMLHEPRQVVLDRPAQHDLEDLPSDIAKRVQPVLEAIEDGNALLEAKHHPLDGVFGVRITLKWRAMVYLGADNSWHLFAINAHDYHETERRWASKSYGSDVILRGLVWELPEGKPGYELAQKISGHRITAAEVIHHLEPLGVWWGVTDQYGGLDAYESHAEERYDGSTIQALKEADQEYKYWADLDPNTPEKGWVAGEAAWKAHLKHYTQEGPSTRFFGCSVPVVLVAKRPVKDGVPWDPAIHNPPSSYPWEGNSYLPHGERLEIVEVRIDSGDGYKSLPGNGIRTTAFHNTPDGNYQDESHQMKRAPRRSETPHPRGQVFHVDRDPNMPDGSDKHLKEYQQKLDAQRAKEKAHLHDNDPNYEKVDGHWYSKEDAASGNFNLPKWKGEKPKAPKPVVTKPKKLTTSLEVTAFPSWRDRGVFPEAEALIAPDQGRARRNSFMVYIKGQPHARRDSLAEAKKTVEDIYGPLNWKKTPGDKTPHFDPTWGDTTAFNDALNFYVVQHLPELEDRILAMGSHRVATKPGERYSYPQKAYRTGDQWSRPELFWGKPEYYHYRGGCTLPLPCYGSPKGQYDPDIVMAQTTGRKNIERVDPRTLTGTQIGVTKQGMNHYLSAEYEKSGITFADHQMESNEIPLVYFRSDGVRLILTGHHRSVAALVKGKMLECVAVHEPEVKPDAPSHHAHALRGHPSFMVYPSQDGQAGHQGDRRGRGSDTPGRSLAGSRDGAGPLFGLGLRQAASGDPAQAVRKPWSIFQGVTISRCAVTHSGPECGDVCTYDDDMLFEHLMSTDDWVKGRSLDLVQAKKDESVAPSVHGDPRLQDSGVTVKKTDKGQYYVCTHRARSKYYDSIDKIPQKDIDFIRSTGSRETFEEEHPRSNVGRFVRKGPTFADRDEQDKFLTDTFGPDITETAKMKHPKSGWNLPIGKEYQVKTPKEGEGPAVWRVKDRGKDLDDPLQGLMGMGTDAPDEPIEYVYRGMSKAEYDQAQDRGYFASDGRGVVADWEGTNAGVNASTAASYLSDNPDGGYLVKFRVDPKRKWFTIPHDGYVRTRERIPLDDVDKAVPLGLEPRGLFYPVDDGRDEAKK